MDIKARAISGGGGVVGGRGRAARDDDGCGGGGGAVLDMIGCQMGVNPGLGHTPPRLNPPTPRPPSPCGGPNGWPRGCASS